ncbi:MarR family transcriptional regulator [Modestobacter sp. VKM Ac-2979]|uniref:MarR family winged helix-turn-helix transcriptional regulator n=1 Tax=unclassified Modestobacter TaxID=2643866 RepID=UPI0022AB841E|nr:MULTISPECIES: MarR family transcriptional regulator [unclassified Modestobacter]MCZ2810148.1 MarR family transcriptional regulator [Modestobacter sp. VKM Ac-2979]MCZ2841634.1 MarR family transcriptional regulator [Modestobacter sp. VKM Ac-2980]
MTSDVSPAARAAGAAAPVPPAPTRWLDAEEQRAWRAWLYSWMLLDDRLDRELTRETGISHAYYEILVQLSETEGRQLRMSQLAERCLSSRSRLSHAVSRLEERGWVRRQVCPEDGRGQLAVLTDEGFAALEGAAPVHVESVRSHLFDQLSPEQVAAMQDIGETLLRHLNDEA